MNYFVVLGPTVHEYRYMPKASLKSCAACGYRLNLHEPGDPVVPDPDRNCFFSVDGIPIVHRDIRHLWKSDAGVIPIGDTQYSQIVPTSVLEVAHVKSCRVETRCDGDDHFSARLGCWDLYSRPETEPAFAEAALPMGSGDELSFPLIVRQDVNRFLHKYELGYRSEMIEFVDD